MQRSVVEMKFVRRCRRLLQVTTALLLLPHYALAQATDQQSAEDVKQTIWLRVVRSLIRLQQPARLASWLYRVARFAVADLLRDLVRDLLGAGRKLGTPPERARPQVASTGPVGHAGRTGF